MRTFILILLLGCNSIVFAQDDLLALVSKPEDVKKYEQRLNNQGKLEQLEKNKEVVAAERKKLKEIALIN